MTDDGLKQSRGAERRQGARFATSFWVCVAGVDEGMQFRRGNISVSGIYFEIDQQVGPPGTTCLLRISPSEEAEAVVLLARVVRVVSYEDLWKGPVVAGVAFEYIVRNELLRGKIRRLVSRLVDRQVSRAKELKVDHSLPARVDQQGGDSSEATVRSFSLGGMIMETRWPVEIGESVHVAVETPDSRKTVRFAGKAIKSNQLPAGEQTRYLTEVQFIEEQGEQAAAGPGQSAGTLGRSISDAIGGLLAEITFCSHKGPPAEGPTQPMSGSLTHIGLPSLLGLLEMERTSGTLRVTRGDQAANLYVHQGQLVDITSGSLPGDPRDAFAAVLTWSDGDFEFRFGPVDREDRIQAKTTALLLDLAIEQDERSRE